jgi:hypothetical protein
VFASPVALSRSASASTPYFGCRCVVGEGILARGGIAVAEIVASKRLVSEGRVITRGHAAGERLKHTYSIAVGGAVTRRSLSGISGVFTRPV